MKLILLGALWKLVGCISFPPPSARLMSDASELEDEVQERVKLYKSLRAHATEKHLKTLDKSGYTPVVHANVPELELEKVAREDVLKEADGGAPRYASRSHVTEGPALGGTWTQLSPDTLQWHFVVSSSGATSLNLGFEHFRLPEGPVMTISSADGSFRWRITSADNKPHNQYWTPPLPGGQAKVTIVMHTEHRQAVEDGVILSRVNVGYRGFHSADHMVQSGTPSSGKCHYDVHCSHEIKGFENEIPCSAVISTGGELFCSGAMLNNLRSNAAPLFLTAQHCDVNETNAASLVTVWNYEDKRDKKLDCPGNDHDESFNFNWLTGATHLASYKPSDFTLLQLDQAPPEEWEVSYCGWSAKDEVTKESVVIHHPNTYHKRKSKDFDESRIYDDWLRVDHYEIGSTERGSSGAPLFNENKLIVGQLNAGTAKCEGKKPNSGYDKYGRLAVSWERGLKQHLDPDGTGKLEHSTLSGLGPADVNRDGKISKLTEKEAYGCGKSSKLQCQGREMCFDPKNIGDGYCDGMDAKYGINACCYDHDGGDCTASQCEGSTGPLEA